MKIEFIAKNYNDCDRLVRIVENKLAALGKYLADDTNIYVKLKGFGKNGEQMKYSMEISLQYRGNNIRSEFTSYNMWDNIDKIVPKLESQLMKIKNRRSSSGKPQNFEREEISDLESASKDTTEKSKKLVKVKNFSISIITVEQAIEELELLEHSFYIFVNADDNKVSIIYKRQDGGYGLITPEY